VAQFKYVETTVTIQNSTQEEIKWRLNSGNPCYSSVESLLSSHLLPKKSKYKKITIFPLILNGYETWSMILREEHTLKVFEHRVLRRTFGPKRDEMVGGLRKLHNEELRNLYYSPNIIRMIKPRRMR
jgi:hypothetical protein